MLSSTGTSRDKVSVQTCVMGPPDSGTVPKRITNIRQTWFMGNHTDVGGENLDSGLASISFLWMIIQFRAFTDVEFDEESNLDELTTRNTYIEKTNTSHRITYTLGVSTSLIHVQLYYIYLGKIHGKETWGNIPYLSGDDARKAFLQTGNAVNRMTEPPPSLNRANTTRDEDIPTSGSMNNASPLIPISESQISYADEIFETTIHHSVRVLVTKREDKCALLQGMKTYRIHDLTAWCNIPTAPKLNGVWEDRVTDWEHRMYCKWIKIKKVFGPSERDQSVEVSTANYPSKR
jgi:hypothetical protein